MVLVARTAVNSGLSATRRRMNRPRTSRTTLSRNGIRHPQDMKAASGSSDTSPKTAVARMRPRLAPLLMIPPVRPAPVNLGVLDTHQHRAAVFTAQRQPLDQAAQCHQDHRCRDTDGGIRWENTDQECRPTHRYQRHHE